MANLEVLRCVAMMMVVVLHYLGKGGLLPDLTAPLSVQDMVAWLLEAFCIVAVNVYMMISGYFLCESSFKLSRLLTLWLQLWLYSVGIGVLAAVTGIVPAAEVSTHYYLTLLFPVTMGHYWFLTAYVFYISCYPSWEWAQTDDEAAVSGGTGAVICCILPDKIHSAPSGWRRMARAMTASGICVCFVQPLIFADSEFLFTEKIPGIAAVSDRRHRNFRRGNAAAFILSAHRQPGTDSEDSV